MIVDEIFPDESSKATFAGGHWELAMSAFWFGIEPDVVLSSSSSSACERSRSVKPVVKIHENFNMLKIPTVRFNVLKHIFSASKSRGSQWRLALFVQEHSDQTGLRADVVPQKCF